MKMNQFAAAAVIALCSMAASAATYTLGTLDSTGDDTLSGKSVKFATIGATIADSWFFTLGVPSDVSFGAQQTFSAPTKSITNFAGTLVGYGALTLSFGADQQNLSWAGNLAAGTYQVDISGLTTARNTQYTSTVFATPAAPVPEPETYALMLAGLGAVTFVARRRKAV